jgi:hypothetical protein
MGNCVGASGVALQLQALYDGGTVGATAAKAKNKDKPPDGASADGPPMMLVSLDFKKAFHSIHHNYIRDVVDRNASELNYYVETMTPTRRLKTSSMTTTAPRQPASPTSAPAARPTTPPRSSTPTSARATRRASSRRGRSHWASTLPACPR